MPMTLILVVTDYLLTFVHLVHTFELYFYINALGYVFFLNKKHITLFIIENLHKFILDIKQSEWCGVFVYLW